jgi:hypothetical protein
LAPLETAPQKGFEQAIVQRVTALLTLFDVQFVALQTKRDFGGERLIPQFPA